MTKILVATFIIIAIFGQVANPKRLCFQAAETQLFKTQQTIQA